MAKRKKNNKIINNGGVLTFFDSLNNFGDIQKLISQGESESQYLECKSPSAPRLPKDSKAEFARHISGFSNAGGGIIIWGVHTDRHGKLDILTQIEPIGSIKNFVKELELAVPLIIEPVIAVKSKIIRQKLGDTKGIAVSYIPGVSGDPIKVRGNGFYLRVGDETKPMPYEVIKRMFLGGISPDIRAIFDQRLVEIQKDEKWKIPIILNNNSNAPGKFVEISVDFNNPLACQEISSDIFKDMSGINPGKTLFMCNVNGLIYKALNIVVGNFFVLMKKNKRLLDITVTIYAENMRARYQRFKIYLRKRKGFKVELIERGYLY